MAQTTSHPTHPTKAPNLQQNAVGDDGINKVRDILFGAKIKEQNENFELFQQRVESRLASLREEYLERVSVLEKYTKEEFKVLTQHLKEEKAERDRTFAKISKSIDDVHHEIEEKLVRQFNDNSKATSEVRGFVLTSLNELSDRVNSAQKKMSEDIGKEIRALNERKLNRLQMAEMLNDWSSQISEKKTLQHQ